MGFSSFLFRRRLQRQGVALLRGFLAPTVAERIRARFEANLARLGEVIPDLGTNSSRNVFSISPAFCENDQSFPDRMAISAKCGPNYLRETVTAAERTLMYEEVGNLLERRLSFLGSPRINEHAVARFELARPTSAYNFYALHQDAMPELTLDAHAWTAWLALSSCGRDAPSLQYVEKRFDRLLPREEGNVFVDPSKVADLHFERPILNPGDLVVFSAYTLHGTWIAREMTKPRYSLDIRLVPTN